MKLHFGLILLVFIFLFSCKRMKAERITNEKESGSTITLRNFIREAFNESGEIQWKLKAAEAYIYIEENKTIVYGVDFDQYEKNKVKSKITGERGELDHKNKLLKLTGNVIVKTTDEKELHSQELIYDLDSESLESEQDVSIYSEGLTIHGKGLIADKNLNKFTILKPKGISKGNPMEKKEEENYE